MSGAAGPPPGGAAAPGREEERLRRLGRGTIAGLVIGVIVVSGALVAVVAGPGGGGDGGGGEAPPGPAEFTHTYPAAYDGPVWVTVSPPDGGVRTVTIDWGPWQRRVVHQGAEPASYWFSKGVDEAGEPAALTVTVEPGAEVEFHRGEPPAGATDVRKEWVRVADRTTATPAP